MIPVHEEPKDIQREFGGLRERCEFCGTPTRYWTADAQHPVCQRCAETHSPSDLKKTLTLGNDHDKQPL